MRMGDVDAFAGSRTNHPRCPLTLPCPQQLFALILYSFCCIALACVALNCPSPTPPPSAERQHDEPAGAVRGVEGAGRQGEVEAAQTRRVHRRNVYHHQPRHVRWVDPTVFKVSYVSYRTFLAFITKRYIFWLSMFLIFLVFLWCHQPSACPVGGFRLLFCCFCWFALFVACRAFFVLSFGSRQVRSLRLLLPAAWVGTIVFFFFVCLFFVFLVFCFCVSCVSCISYVSCGNFSYCISCASFVLCFVSFLSFLRFLWFF